MKLAPITRSARSSRCSPTSSLAADSRHSTAAAAATSR